ncbi:MAG: ThuA domain-containing protein [Pseudomonadota bacterium]
MSQRKNIALVCAGKYHDIDYARLELLKLLAEHPDARVTVHDNYALGDVLDDCACLISYTCDVVAGADDCERLRRWLAAGGRWFALHGTNSVIEFVNTRPLEIATPDTAPEFMQLLGSQFQAHPPICSYTVNIADRDHPLTAGLEDFQTTDEMYLCKMTGDYHLLLSCDYTDPVPEFTSTDWQHNAVQPVMYLQDHADGNLLYLTLGHCRGHYDMQPLTDYYPNVERCSWEVPEYHELLRRGLKWALRK